jgi:YebC/PmpR family DNA-binding regulatory protein
MGRSFENRKHAIFKTAAIKSKLYSRYGKLLYVAAKNGVPNPENNPTLRHLVERAKREQVPAHVIDRAIEKAAGAGGEDFVTVRYEGFGPGGCSVIVDCLTDNNNRTITDVRNCFNRTGSRMGPTGSVSHMFDHVALFQFAGDDGDKVLEVMLNADVDVDDVESDGGQISLYAKASEFFKAKTALQEGFPGLELETAEVTWLPQSTKQISGEDAQTFKKFLDLLNECDDVQEVYHNAVLAEE